MNSTITRSALLTDLYELTMAYGYWKLGRAERESVFHLFFRTLPFGSGYAVAAGLGPAVEFLESFSFGGDEIDYLAGLTGNDDRQLFEPDFLDYLSALRLTVDIDAIAEGELVFGQEPLVRVRGPILQCQLLETALLTCVNFQTLVATKASRIREAAPDDAILEFGLRRAQGFDGGLSASRAAYVGGCDATSNVLAGMRFGIPVKGTHAHSWVMSFPDEIEAFRRYADAMPNNGIFLVDTYDTLEGVRKAVEVGRRLREQGHEMVGIRLDSGDLADLSNRARQILDDAGFSGAKIVASGELDEYSIAELKRRGAEITVWGVGTKLATAYDEPALGGVYKLGAIRDKGGSWHPKLKISEQPIKSTLPGMLQVRRFHDGDGYTGDMIFDELSGYDPRSKIVDFHEPARHRTAPPETQGRDILIPVFRGGQLVWTPDDAAAARERCRREVRHLHPDVRRLRDPVSYPVGLDVGLHERREEMAHG